MPATMPDVFSASYEEARERFRALTREVPHGALEVVHGLTIDWAWTGDHDARDVVGRVGFKRGADVPEASLEKYLSGLRVIGGGALTSRLMQQHSSSGPLRGQRRRGCAVCAAQSSPVP